MLVLSFTLSHPLVRWMPYHLFAHDVHRAYAITAFAAVAMLLAPGVAHAATPLLAQPSLRVDDVEHSSADAEPSGSYTTSAGRYAADALMPIEAFAWLLSSGALAAAPRCCHAVSLATGHSTCAADAGCFCYYRDAGCSAARWWLCIGARPAQAAAAPRRAGRSEPSAGGPAATGDSRPRTLPRRRATLPASAATGPRPALEVPRGRAVHVSRRLSINRVYDFMIL